MTAYNKYRKNLYAYLKAHPDFNALIHVLVGISIGLLIASPLAFPHPVRWATVFLLLSLAGHLYAANRK